MPCRRRSATRKVRQRELSVGDPLDADATDEHAIFAPADEGSRELGSSGRSRVPLRARNEGLHLGVVGAATEIDESHSVRSQPGSQPRGRVSRRPRRSRRTPPWARALPSPHRRDASGPARIRDRSRLRRCGIPPRGWRTGRHRRRRTRAPSTPGSARSPRHSAAVPHLRSAAGTLRRAPGNPPARSLRDTCTRVGRGRGRRC